jgi:hypothetical protein
MKVEAKPVTAGKPSTPATSKTDPKKPAQKAGPQPKVAEKTKPAKIPKPHPIEEPAYSVSVTARDPDENELQEQSQGYSPRELRAKAKSFLQSPSLPPEQREVLAKVIQDQEDAENAELKHKVSSRKS